MNSTKELPASVRPAAAQAPLRGYVIVLAGTFVWALTGIFIKILLTQYGMHPLTIAFWRVGLVAAFMLMTLAIVNRKLLRIARSDLLFFFVHGLIGVAIHQIVWITSVQYNGAAVATVIIYTAPALVALLAWRFLHETMGWTKLIALGLTILGCVLVARAYDLRQLQLNWIGLLAGIGSACTLSSYSLLGRAISRRYSAWTSILWAFLFGTISLLPVSLLTGGLVPSYLPIDGWGTLIFLALVPTLGGFASYTIGLAHLPASVASILAAFEPVTTAIVAYFVFGEILDSPQLLGAALILWGVLLLRPKSASTEQKENGYAG